MSVDQVMLNDAVNIISSMKLSVPDRNLLTDLSSDKVFHESIRLIKFGGGDASEIEKAKLYVAGTVLCLDKGFLSRLARCGINYSALFPQLVGISRKHAQILVEQEAFKEKSIQAPEMPVSGVENEFVNHYLFSSDHALCFNAAIGKDKFHTITVDAAVRNGESVSWKSKISFQLTERELPEFYSAIKKYQSGFKFNNHNKKSLEAKWQDKNLFFNFAAQGFCAGVPAKLGDVFILATLSLRQLQKNYKFMSVFEIDKLVKESAQHF